METLQEMDRDRTLTMEIWIITTIRIIVTEIIAKDKEIILEKPPIVVNILTEIIATILVVGKSYHNKRIY